MTHEPSQGTSRSMLPSMPVIRDKEWRRDAEQALCIICMADNCGPNADLAYGPCQLRTHKHRETR